MSTDEERYQVCFECVFGDEHMKKDCPSFQVRVLSRIRECMRLGHKWYNIRYYAEEFIGEKYFSKILCKGCPYQLEHVVLNGKPVIAYESGHSDIEYYERKLQELSNEP